METKGVTKWVKELTEGMSELQRDMEDELLLLNYVRANSLFARPLFIEQFNSLELDEEQKQEFISFYNENEDYGPDDLGDDIERREVALASVPRILEYSAYLSEVLLPVFKVLSGYFDSITKKSFINEIRGNRYPLPETLEELFYILKALPEERRRVAVNDLVSIMPWNTNIAFNRSILKEETPDYFVSLMEKKEMSEEQVEDYNRFLHWLTVYYSQYSFFERGLFDECQKYTPIVSSEEYPKAVSALNAIEHYYERMKKTSDYGFSKLECFFHDISVQFTALIDKEINDEESKDSFFIELQESMQEVLDEVFEENPKYVHLYDDLLDEYYDNLDADQEEQKSISKTQGIEYQEIQPKEPKGMVYTRVRKRRRMYRLESQVPDNLYFFKDKKTTKEKERPHEVIQNERFKLKLLHLYKRELFDEPIAFLEFYNFPPINKECNDENKHLFSARELDGLLITSTGILIIEYKSHQGEITRTEDDRWFANGEEIDGGASRSVFEQAFSNRSYVIHYFHSLGISISNARLLVIFGNKSNWDSVKIAKKEGWFHITDMKNVKIEVRGLIRDGAKNKLNVMDVVHRISKNTGYMLQGQVLEDCEEEILRDKELQELEENFRNEETKPTIEPSSFKKLGFPEFLEQYENSYSSREAIVKKLYQKLTEGKYIECLEEDFLFLFNAIENPSSKEQPRIDCKMDAFQEVSSMKAFWFTLFGSNKGFGQKDESLILKDGETIQMTANKKSIHESKFSQWDKRLNSWMKP
ncbi:MAG: NERD domain-containing protein [Bacteroidaceae bacterium]|nr:NERD domain-containing protein [Bacteroidaceae bacterium]